MVNNCIQISDPRGSTEHLELVKYTPEQQPLNMSSHLNCRILILTTTRKIVARSAIDVIPVSNQMVPSNIWRRISGHRHAADFGVEIEVVRAAQR